VREESEWGWAGSVDRPRPELGRLSRARVGRLGQLANWAKQALANYFKTKFQIQIQMLFPFWIQTKLKNSNNSNKTLSYSLAVLEKATPRQRLGTLRH
jgi:hypothetical protein